MLLSNNETNYESNKDFTKFLDLSDNASRKSNTVVKHRELYQLSHRTKKKDEEKVTRTLTIGRVRVPPVPDPTLKPDGKRVPQTTHYLL